jgi:ABC-type nitrate/sulfonate/bicarbonate transport system substrate-binding protein
VNISRRKALMCIGSGLASCSMAAPALAARKLDKVTVVSSHRGIWDTTFPEWGIDKGFFKDEGIDANLIWGGGGANTLQMLVSGSADILLGNGFDATIAAFSQGAPVYVISGEKMGAAEFYWYSKVGSGIKTMNDAAGKKMGYSHPGASTEMIASALSKAANVKIDLIPTGEMSANLTAVMSGQIALGWAAVPFGLEQEEKGEIQTVATGNDVPGVSHQTIRVNVASKGIIDRSKDTVRRFLKAYKKTLDWAYSSDEALERFAKLNKVPVSIAKKAVKIGYAKSSLELLPITGIDRTMNEAIAEKLITKPLSKQQLHDLLQYTPLASG